MNIQTIKTQSEIACEACGNYQFYQYPYPTDLSILKKKIVFVFFRRLVINPIKFFTRVIFIFLPKSVHVEIRRRAWSPYKKIQSPRSVFRSLKKLDTGLLLFKDRTIAVCTTCGLGVVRPTIREEQLITFYQEDYWISDSGEIEPAENNRTIGTYELLKKYLNFTSFKNALEFGSASAHFARFIKSKEPHLKFDIVDPGAKWQTILEEHIDSIYTSIGDIKDTYDIILSSHALEHIPDVHRYFEYFYDLLKVGGYLYFEIPNSEERDIIFGDNPDYHFPHTYFFTQKAFEYIAKEFKLKIIFSKTFSRSYMERLNKTRFEVQSSQENPQGAYLRILFKKE